MTKILSFLKPYRAAMISVLVLLCLQTLGTLFIPTLTADIVNSGIVKGDVSYILETGGKMLLVAAATGICAVVATYLSSNLSSGLGRDVRNSIFERVQKYSLQDFQKIGTASMITRSTSDVTQIQQAFMMTLQLILPAPIIMVGGLTLSFSKDPVMALFIVAAVAIFGITAFLVGRKTVPLFIRLQKGMDGINRILRENITGVRVIRAFNRVQYEKKRVNRTFEDYAATAIRVNKIFAVMIPVILLVMNLCTLSIVWFGGQRVSAGFMQIGDIMALIEYAVLILFYLIMGIMVFMIIPRAQACAARIGEVLELEPEIGDSGAAEKVVLAQGAKLEFRGVTFRYKGAEEPVLDHLDFSCRAGEVTAIIGGTGSGKSTIASLIPRFYDIQEGSILIDGTDIRSMSQQVLRDKIGFVPQKAFLFSGTVAENLRYGKEDASLEQMQHAAKVAQADHFISRLPNGYESRVEQGGNNFSGGQKQRLAIARALVRQADIYVFDDSFSALDVKTDARLRAALQEETKQSAVILVAQRVSTIMNANQIIVLDNGAIAGIGTHKQLMESCALYQQIAKSQLSEEELA